MPRSSQRAGDPPDIKVFIRDTRGRFLAQDANGLFFTYDRPAAMVFDYRADEVPAQLEVIQKVHGLALAADPVPPEEIYEACDRCRELYMPFMIYFDGKRFLCPECRGRAGRSGRG